jgi:hypothetical protein
MAACRGYSMQEGVIHRINILVFQTNTCRSALAQQTSTAPAIFVRELPDIVNQSTAEWPGNQHDGKYRGTDVFSRYGPLPCVSNHATMFDTVSR